ncbi:MAG: hypothetical protein CVV64_03310 [Candidatus Wallbacteria bacterium HGW-Wallbacteria-1]|jgi:hypothetical protein|uniref:Uncharacterized protein n=1 Tax=Candidatus Wallbacteria bacterium HGW-Wallbacteria-1 TaxID=2013854 RepID=A0A2N1PTM9_9BACT|nr:MAG: hypothetical protein CVV64_03310 [Candidatus Wallbacteria bacterium HGW-Wallbacteria-1]
MTFSFRFTILILIVSALFITAPLLAAGPASGTYVSEDIRDKSRLEKLEKLERDYDELYVPEIVDLDIQDTDPAEVSPAGVTGEVKTTSADDSRGVGGAGYYPSLNVFGQTGYIFMPSVEISQSNHPVGYGSFNQITSNDFDISMVTTGLTWSPFRNFEIGVNRTAMNFKSPHDLGYVFPNISLDGVASSISLKYLATKPRSDGFRNWDNAWAVGLVIPTDTFSEFSGPVQNVLNVIKDTFVSEEWKPTGFLSYGGFDLSNRYSVSLFASFGQAFSTGIGFRSNILDVCDFSMEYVTGLHTINGVDIDKNQYGAKLMIPIGYGVRLTCHYSFMDMNFGGSVMERFGSVFENAGASLEAKF